MTMLVVNSNFLVKHIETVNEHEHELQYIQESNLKLIEYKKITLNPHQNFIILV